MEARMDRWKEGGKGGQMHGSTNGWMDGQLVRWSGGGSK